MSLAILLGWLRRVPAWVWVALLCVAGLWFFGRYQKEQGREEVRADWKASIEKGKKEIERIKAESERVTVKVETKYVARIKEVCVKGETIVQRIPVYISRDLPELPGSFRVWHDAAAQNVIPEASADLDAASVAPVDVAATVAANYATCHATAEQLTGLQEWVREQQRINP